jgi:hypothetical protein
LTHFGSHPAIIKAAEPNMSSQRWAKVDNLLPIHVDAAAAAQGIV